MKAMGIKKIYEDDHIMVIDKPAGIEMGEFTARSLGEGWPAHRLDKDTSGLLVIAKNEDALQKLQDQFKKRQVTKQYLALVYGLMKPEAGELVTEIVRDSSRRVPFKAIAVASGLERGDPRVAKTAWQTSEQITVNGEQMTLLNITIATGRTHQIRVHMKYLGHPIMGDQTYATKPSKKASQLLGLTRQFLHAHKLGFVHPVTKQVLDFKSELPTDLAAKIAA